MQKNNLGFLYQKAYFVAFFNFDEKISFIVLFA